jgi:excinuclease ABC subunit C
VTVNEEWPRPVVFRGRKRKGVRYFGPYGHVRALRETLDLLLRSFPLRTCSDAKFKRHARLGRPCLLYDIERCSGPCVGAVEPERYGEMVEDLMRFLSGETQPVLSRLRAEMEQASEALEFERAARLRDRLIAVGKAAETQQMVSERAEDLDIVGIAEDDLEAAIQVFHVRRGRVVGRSGSVADKVEDLTPEQFMERVLQELYGAPDVEVPRRVLVPLLPDSPEVMTDWLSALRGGPVQLSVPQRGDKRALHETVTRNAAEDLTRHRLRRSADHNARSKALTELEAALGLSQSPLRIECFDMSHLQGTDYVGSMVVFEDGLAKKPDYRRFIVRGVHGNDDYAAMEEVLTRRLSNLIRDRDELRIRRETPVGDDLTERRAAARKRFAYAPQLLVLDGGKGQLAVGVRVLESLGLSDEIEVAALAKQFEEVYRPGDSEPIRIPRGSEALYLLQRVRDEAHRFAITFHRERRARRMTTSILDGIPGLGPARKKRLVAAFGGMRALRAATPEELAALPWLPDAVAAALIDRLRGTTPARRTG